MTHIDWNSLIPATKPPLLSSWSDQEERSQQQAPSVVSVAFKKPSLVKTTSLFFGDSEDSDQAPTVREKPNARPKNSTPSAKAQEYTRIKPSSDVIKLQDRLFYLLQPPLETLLSGRSMTFPFEPFHFQYAGVAFLFPRHSAILADEMGLGKSMQAITAIRLLLRTKQIKRILMVCPKPLMTNWQREFATWAPEITVGMVEGNQQQRRWHWQADHVMVKVANYELMTRDEGIVTDPSHNFDLVILDEAQRVKNKSNATSQVVQKIPRRRSWALTGTPIENSVEDLVGICEFVAPGTVASGMPPKAMRENVSDMILRRTKDLVMTDMPPRLLRDAQLPLSAEQSTTYQSAEKDGVVRLNNMGDSLTIKHVFELVLRLKQICNFDPATGESSKVDRLKADMEEVAASGQKAIVFSQWVDTLTTIEEHLSDFQPLQYHGRIPSKQRDPILKEFKENPDRNVLLMSYGAGAVGLNLQFCRYVFLYDRWWNPAVEDQAINRAHRIGAAGSVTVTRMIMEGTIEQRIHELLEAKRELFREVLSDTQSPSRRGLSRDEIFGLFDLSTPQGKFKPILEPEKKAA